MNTNAEFNNRRLLESLEYIDDDIISGVCTKIKPSDAQTGTLSARRKFKAWRQFAALAACLVLLSAVIPLVAYLEQNNMFFPGGFGANPSDTTSRVDHYHIENVGEVPEAFKAVVDNNILENANISGDKIIKKMSLSLENKYLIRIYDFYGNLLSTAELENEPSAYNLSDIHATSDGNYLAIIAISISHDSETGGDTVDDENMSKIIKFDSNGNILFETFIENTFYFSPCFIETDIGYFFADTYVGGEMFDVTVTYIDFDGTIIANKTLKGTKSDSLEFAECNYNSIWLYIHTRSSDGDYPEDGYWRFSLDNNLEIYKKVKIDYDDIPRSVDRYVNGTPIYNIKEFIPDFDAGTVRHIIEYDDCVLVVSNNIFVTLSYNPAASFAFTLSETVYSGYSKAGELLWRSVVNYCDASCEGVFISAP